MRTLTRSVRAALALGVALASSCAGNPNFNSGQLAPASSASHSKVPPAFNPPALIVFDVQTGALEYWPIQHGGGTQLQLLSEPLHIYNPRALAANDNVVAIAAYSPSKIVLYDVVKKVAKTLDDPYGTPYDIAIDKHANIYALQVNSVAVFKIGSSNPTKLTCFYMDVSEAIAVDNEGDVLVNGNGPGGFVGVVEYPAGSKNCVKLHLRPVRGFIGGIGIDPKTDDLIVVDNPGQCVGFTGRMIIYPKPYEARSGIQHMLSGTRCAQRFRLDASSEHIFVLDSNYLGFPFVDQNRYPSGKNEGAYTNGYYASGNFTGLTTIPNTLPN